MVALYTYSVYSLFIVINVYLKLLIVSISLNMNISLRFVHFLKPDPYSSQALLMDMRSQLVKQKATADMLEKEVKARRLEVKSLELQLRNCKQPADDSDIIKELDTLRAQLV